MNLLEIQNLEELRTKNGFYEKDFNRYISFCKQLQKRRTIFQGEILLSKYFLMKESKKQQRKFIKKMEKVTFQNEFYSFYIKTFIKLFKNENNEAYNDFIIIRSQLSNCNELSNEIESYLRGLNKDYKFDYIEREWYDIKLLFENENQINNFFEKRIKSNESSYQQTIKNFIIDYLKQYNLFLKYIKESKKKDIKVLLIKCNKICNVLELFHNKLQENYQESEYVLNLKRIFKNLKEFFKNLNDFENGKIEKENEIQNFEINQFFEEIKENLLKLKELKKIDKKQSKIIVASFLKKEMMEMENPNINMPFLPTFYDLAFDHIKYPKEVAKKSISSILSNFNLFGKK